MKKKKEEKQWSNLESRLEIQSLVCLFQSGSYIKTIVCYLSWQNISLSKQDRAQKHITVPISTTSYWHLVASCPVIVSSTLQGLTYSLWAHLVQAIQLVPASQEAQEDLFDPNRRNQF